MKYFKQTSKLPKAIQDSLVVYPNIKDNIQALTLAVTYRILAGEGKIPCYTTVEDLLAYLNLHPEEMPSTATVRNCLKALGG